MADTEFTDENIRHRFFRDLVEAERLKVFKAFGVYPEDCTERLNHGIEHRLLNRILRRATPPSPSTAPEVSVEQILQLVCEHTGRRINLDLEQLDQYIAFARAVIALRPRVKLAPALKAALEEATKTGATSVMLPGGESVFINRGHDYGDNAHLECTACGGSGHIDDQQQIALASCPAEVDDAGAGPGGQMAVEQAETRMDAGFQPVVAVAQEVDDEGLPALPPASGRIYVQNGYTRASTRPGKGLPLFTAEQYRQGQRDAVAADRAQRERRQYLDSGME